MFFYPWTTQFYALMILISVLFKARYSALNTPLSVAPVRMVPGGSSYEVNDSEKMSERKERGCFVSVVAGFILLLVALCIAVGIGIIVYFATINTKCEVTSQNVVSTPSSPVPSELQWQACKNLSIERNQCPDVCLGTASSVSPIPQTTLAPSSPKDVRLPTDIVPYHYKLELTPNIYADDWNTFTFDGKVDIFCNCTRETQVIILHVKQLTIDNSSIKLQTINANATAPMVVGWHEDKERQFLKIKLRNDLTPGDTYILSLHFHGALKPDLTGMYISSYNDGGKTKWLATTQMQPTDARKVFPCFDEPAFKATFATTLLRKTPMKTLSNMPIARTETREDDWLADQYTETPKMSTYLLAFVVCDFSYTEKRTQSGTKVRVWAQPGAIDQASYALDVGAKVLEFFDMYFNLSFPLPKLDMLAVPDFPAGAMENWGLVMYGETYLLYDPSSSSSVSKRSIAKTIAHELAHQWFGNLVTPEWWDDLWLNEGFATYMGYLGVNYVHPDWHIMEQFVTSTLHPVLESDSLRSSHPIHIPVTNPDEIGEIFDDVSYKKGAALIRMINFLMGEENFRSGLMRYLESLAYQNARNTHLWAALNQVAQESGVTFNITELMNTWVLQMGYPVVTIKRHFTNKARAEVTQQHFLLGADKSPSDDKYPSPFQYKWIIPLTYTTSVAPNYENPKLVWMKFTNATIYNLDESSKWLLGNIGENGFYRVNYDDCNWESLLEQLQDDHTVIPTKNRAQIIDDAFNLGRTGMISQLVGMKATEYLLKEEDYVPWKTAARNLEFLGLMLQRSEYYGMFQQYMQRQIKPQYGSLSWNSDVSDTYLQKLRRILAIEFSCTYGMETCLKNASQLYKQWMKNSTENRLSPELNTIVLCHGIQMGGQAEWDFAYEQFQSSKIATEKLNLVQAMTCTRQPWLLRRYLTMSLDPSKLQGLYPLYVMADMGGNPVGLPLLWNFMRENWPVLLERYGGGIGLIRYIIALVTKGFNTDSEYRQLQELKRTYPNLKGGERAFQQALERTNNNIRWMKDNEKKIGDWLKDALN